MPSSRHAAARQQFMLPCTCNHASDMYPVCQQRRVTAQETCSPNACPDVSKAVQPIPRVPASLLQAYRCGTQAASRKVCLSVSVCPCVRRAACLMGGPCYALQQASELGEEAGGCIQQGSFRCYIHPSRLPAECILRASLALSHGMCIKVFSLSSLPGRDIWDSPKMSLASGPAVLATLPGLVLEESTRCFHPIPLSQAPISFLIAREPPLQASRSMDRRARRFVEQTPHVIHPTQRKYATHHDMTRRFTAKAIERLDAS
jgi:hypothetical protein